MKTRTARKQRVSADAAQSSVSRDAFVQRCRVLELSVKRQPGITQAMIDQMKPGAGHVSTDDADAWHAFEIHLVTLRAQGPQQPTQKRKGWTPEHHEALRTAAANDGVVVRFDDGSVQTVYQKSEYALRRCVTIDYTLQWVTEKRLRLLNIEPTPKVLELLRICDDLTDQLEREFAWIVCQPGADVPWIDDGQWEHPTPEWTSKLTPLDRLAIRQTYLQVNVLQINLLLERMQRQSTSAAESMPVAAFLGMVADSMGVQLSVIARRYSLAELLAQRIVMTEAHERAEAEAERKAAQNRGKR